MSIIRGQRPDLTPAQIAGGIPVVANLLHAFGVFSLSAQQTDSLQMTVLYGLGLVAGDAIVRVGRNVKDARVEATALAAGGDPRADLDEDYEHAEEDIVLDEEILTADAIADDLEGEPLPDPLETRPAGERPDEERPL